MQLQDVSLRGFEWADNSGSTEKAALVNEIRKRKRAAGKFPPTPNGWFGVMESDQLKKGEAKDAVICGQLLTKRILSPLLFFFLVDN